MSSIQTIEWCVLVLKKEFLESGQIGDRVTLGRQLSDEAQHRRDEVVQSVEADPRQSLNRLADGAQVSSMTVGRDLASAGKKISLFERKFLYLNICIHGRTQKSSTSSPPDAYRG